MKTTDDVPGEPYVHRYGEVTLFCPGCGRDRLHILFIGISFDEGQVFYRECNWCFKKTDEAVSILRDKKTKRVANG